MESTALFTVAKGALLPKDDRAEDMLKNKLNVGDKVLVKVHRARNPEHNGLAHKVFDVIAKATGYSPEVIKFWLKNETGRVDLVKLPTGKYMQAPRSMRFESMSQDEFQAFWDEAWVIIGEQVMPHIPEKDFEEIRSIVTRSVA